MSCVTCHMSCVTCIVYLFYFFISKKFDNVVEGLLSMGPTLSSFLGRNLCILRFVALKTLLWPLFSGDNMDDKKIS